MLKLRRFKFRVLVLGSWLRQKANLEKEKENNPTVSEVRFIRCCLRFLSSRQSQNLSLT